MRSTFAGLNTMVSGINTYRLGLDTVGHNISNANTAGYSRQSVDPAAVSPSRTYSYYGATYIGNGTGALSINRARDIYADKQFWRESANMGYYDTRLTNFNKIEEIFNDSKDNGLQAAINEFYTAWVDLSTNASTTSNRTAVIQKGRSLAEKTALYTKQVQEQIYAEYEDLRLNVERVNQIIDSVVDYNKSLLTMEANGAKANDLRDQRDLLVDELSSYLNISVSEDMRGMYTVVSNGTTLVNGIDSLHLQLGNRVDNEIYGVADYTLQIKETGTFFNGLMGTLKANLDNIAEDKGFLDHLSNISAFLLTTLNDQHKAGVGIDRSAKTNTNFYGEDDHSYAWALMPGSTTEYALRVESPDGVQYLRGVKIMSELHVNSLLQGQDGEKYVAARSYEFDLEMDGSVKTETLRDAKGNAVFGVDGQPVQVPKYKLDAFGNKIVNGTGDGSNATLISAIFNLEQRDIDSSDGAQPSNFQRSIGTVSLNVYYNTIMTNLGLDTETTLDNIYYEENALNQIDSWRAATAGVDWNEELTMMITYQKGWNACARCLTAMDEMLERLISSTGVVGR